MLLWYENVLKPDGGGFREFIDRDERWKMMGMVKKLKREEEKQSI